MSRRQADPIEIKLPDEPGDLPSAIIIAAGMGRRLLPHTEALPKCMLSLGLQTILQQQIRALGDAGIETISIVRGYMKQKIVTDQHVTFFENINYTSNNILESLFCAEPAIQGSVVICYSDILYTPDIVRDLLASTADVAVAVDRDWRKHYVGRTMHPLAEAEKVILDDHANVTKIGKHLDDSDSAVAGEFIGMLRLSTVGSSLFKSHFRRCQADYGHGRFHQAHTLSKAYLTDFLQELVDQGEVVHAVPTAGRWMEIDTVQDLERARRKFGNSS